MSDTTPSGYSPAYSQVKTSAVRISEDLRAQLDIIAQLNDRSVTEEIRLSIEAWIEKSKSDPAVLQRAEFSGRKCRTSWLRTSSVKRWVATSTTSTAPSSARAAAVA